MCNLGSMDFLIMRNHDYLFYFAKFMKNVATRSLNLT